MTTIGTFTASKDGFTGTVRTLTVNVKVKIVPTDKTNPNAPDFRILAGSFEIGAAWRRTAQNSQREYLSVMLDDPSFPDTLYANLVQTEGSDDHSLIWSRSKDD
jgi:uncharacterized protein (DUF736 family)